MGDSTNNTRICRLCNREIGIKAFGSHVKRKHQIDFIDYAKKFKDDFSNIRECVICKELCFSAGKEATCSINCLTQLRRSWVGDKSPKKGIACSDLAKFNISKSRKEQGNEYRRGFKFTQKSKDKMSKTALLNASKPNYKNGMSGKTHTPEAIQKILSHRKMNKLEKLVADILDFNQIRYTFQFFINKNGTCKSYDFKLKDSNIILEIDGDFWHGNESSNVKYIDYKKVQENDKLKTRLAKKEGFRIIRLWESDIKADLSIIIKSINRIL